MPWTGRPAVHRQRLIDRLDRGANLTVVTAPAGAGKSVLLAQWKQWLHDRGRTVLSTSIDASHPSEQLLWEQAVHQLAATGAVSDPDELDHDARGFWSLRDLDAAMIRVFGNLTDECVLIIDRAERVDPDSLMGRVHRILDRAPLLRVVVSTRRPICPTHLPMFLGGAASFLDGTDLALTPAESAEILDGVTTQPVAAEVAAAATTPMSARILGMALRLGHLQPDDGAAAPRLVADATIDTFAFADSPEAQRRFLLETAIPSIANCDVAERLGWGDDARTFFDRAQEAGLGHWETRLGQEWFSYTPLFRVALLGRLAERPVEEVRRVRRIVALWAADHRLPIEAVENALGSHDFDLASRLCRRFWFPIAQTAPEAAIRMMRRVPGSELARHSTLSVFCALMFTAVGQRLRALPHFRRGTAVTRSSRSEPDDRVELVWVLAIRALAERFTFRYRESGATARRVVDLVGGLTERELTEVENSVSLFLSDSGWSLFYDAAFGEAANALHLGLEFRVEDDNAGWYHCASLLAALRALQGRIADARSALALIEAANVPEHWRVDIFGVPEQIAQAIVACAELDVERAQAHLDSIAFHNTSTDHWPFLVGVQATVLAMTGQRREALIHVEAALQPGAHQKTSAFAEQFVLTLGGIISVSNGHPLPKSKLSRGFGVAPRMLGAMQAHLRGAHDEVLVIAGAIADGRSPEDNRFARVTTKLLCAIAAAALDRHEFAARAASEACASLAADESFLSFLLLSRVDVELIRELLSGQNAAFVDSYLERTSGRPDLFQPLASLVTLTTREQAVLSAMATHPTVGDAAASLHVSPSTVKNQLRSAYRKLGVSTRADALLRASELGLLGEG
ncbi:LuxR C-terminal-related transcriptional regulator [Leifsonia lichenia]